MSSKNFLMPTVQEFLAKKKIYDDRKDPIWVLLEREMKELEEKGNKPYNEVVGIWLRFLKDLKFYKFRQSKRIEKKLHREVGPPWYCELSDSQRKVLEKLAIDIHQDLLEDLPKRTRRALSELGITLKFPKALLMETIKHSVEDPGVFMWELYKAVYKQSPNELRGSYDMNATIMLSSIVFIDLDECIKSMKELLRQEAPKRPEPPPKKKTYSEPKCRYGSYLQKMQAPLVSHEDDTEETPKKPPPLQYRLKLKSDESFERLGKDMGFLEKRRERNRKAAQKERVCNYKFWEPPSTLRNTDPKMAAYMEKLKVMKLRAKPKFGSKFENSQYLITGVAYPNDHPQYILGNVSILPTGFIPINGGIIGIGDDKYVTNILGHWKYPKDTKERCSKGCDCLAKWDDVVMQYLEGSKCKCHHLYDYYHSGTSAEKYFYPPSKTGPYWFDKAKIYQIDPMEDFIKDTVRRAEKSRGTTPEPSMPEVSAEGLQVKELLKTFLSDLSDTPLMIPHLPKAFLLNNIQDWVRRRVQGDLEPKQHKQLNLHAQRNWLNLKHMDFRARAYKIPFTQKELHNMTWAQRKMIQQLFNKLLDDFVTRNRLKQLEQTRLWWSTMNHDTYHGKSFLDVFFTYMPGRMKDTYLINPFSSENTPKYGAKTCPLQF